AGGGGGAEGGVEGGEGGGGGVGRAPPARGTIGVAAGPGEAVDRSSQTPPFCAWRHHAPACTARRPATSLMGARSGSEPSSSSRVSYPSALTRRSCRTAASSGLAARCRYVNRILSARSSAYSDGSGSFTLRTS